MNLSGRYRSLLNSSASGYHSFQWLVRPSGRAFFPQPGKSVKAYCLVPESFATSGTFSYFANLLLNCDIVHFFIRSRWHHNYMKGFLVITTLIFLMYGSPAVAHYSTGVDAYNKGDYATAYREWKLLAKQGVVDAQYNLGWMYDYGKGVKKYYKNAVKWYQLAADQGHAGSQYKLALMYQKGRGVTRDYGVAVKLYEKAVKQGHTEAHYNLGSMYVDGKGVSKDYKTARKWFQLAAEQGSPDARSNLGDMYQHGYGVIQDYRLAHMWLNISASQGNKEAVVKRNMLELIMTPDDISRAHDLSRECEIKDFKGC